MAKRSYLNKRNTVFFNSSSFILASGLNGSANKGDMMPHFEALCALCRKWLNFLTYKYFIYFFTHKTDSFECAVFPFLWFLWLGFASALPVCIVRGRLSITKNAVVCVYVYVYFPLCASTNSLCQYQSPSLQLASPFRNAAAAATSTADSCIAPQDD